MLTTNQLVQCTIKAHLDNQAINNVLWYRPISTGGMALESLVKQLAAIWQSHVMPRLSHYYHLYEIEGRALSGITNTYSKTVTNTLTGARMLWSETYSWSGDVVGGFSTSPPAPTFAAYSIEKNTGTSLIVEPTTGVTSGAGGGGKDGGGGRRQRVAWSPERRGR